MAIALPIWGGIAYIGLIPMPSFMAEKIAEMESAATIFPEDWEDDTVAASLSAAAQAFMDQGLAAAAVQDWKTAISSFRSAQKESPANSAIMFNLALAYDSAGGHDLLALCWFHAYLAAAPFSDNAAAVKSRLPDIEASVEKKMQKMAVIAGNAATRLRKDISPAAAAALAYTGDIRAAYGVVDNDSSLRNQAFQETAIAQAALGDFQGARWTLTNVTQSPDDILEMIGNFGVEELLLNECDPSLADNSFYGLRHLRFSCSFDGHTGIFQDARSRNAFVLAAANERPGGGHASVDGDARNKLAEAGIIAGYNVPAITYLYDGVSVSEKRAKKIQAALARNLDINIGIERRDEDLRARPWIRLAETLTRDVANDGALAATDMPKFAAFLKTQDTPGAAKIMADGVKVMALTLHKIRRMKELEDQ